MARARSSRAEAAGAALAAIAGLSACFNPSYRRPQCPEGECPEGLFCVAGYCELQPPPDAMPDTQPDATLCLGSSLRVCLQVEPTAPLTISAPEVLDTDLSPRCVTTTSVTGDGDYCVVAATSISIEAELRATGTRPLVLLAVDSITTTARIDVGSRRGPDPEVGAGADSAACGLGTPPEPGGGGAGGSFASSGGPGGASFGGDGGVPEAPVSSVTILRGGCRGQDGEGQLQIGSGGHGGGAVFLFAGTRIDVKEGINAAGEGGAGGAPGDDFPVGGGGGGSGGMIGLDAPTITCSGVLLATGGGGGGGNDGFLSRSGMPGSDPVTTARAPGGEGPQRGGDGGDGSISADIGGEAGDRGLDQLGGGGGGGGGAGIIKVPASVTLGCEVAPAPTP